MPHVGKTVARLAGLLAATIFSTAVHAAGEESGSIVADWHLYGDGILFFELAGTHNGSPCSFAERWAIDTNTPLGRTQYSAFLVATTTGKTVQLIGTGSCAHGNTELVFTMRVIG